MIIARSQGRAGNQLFVVSALLRVKGERERLVLHGFDAFDCLLEASSPEIRYVRFPRVPGLRHSGLAGRVVGALDRSNWNLLESVLKFLSRLHITKIVSLSKNGDRLEFSRGLLPIALFDGGYCQDEKLLDLEEIRKFWKIKTEAESAWLAGFKLTPETLEGGFSCFVHVRRTDYLHWPSPDFPAALDPEWFLEQMAKVRKRVDTPVRFLVFSDDPNFCRNAFSDVPEVVIVDDRVDLSFLAMSHCQAGILSASTFSWWAAKLAAVDQPGPFIAPRYWFGSRRKQWVDSPTPVDGFLEWA
jgi:hypothetical protein